MTRSPTLTDAKGNGGIIALGGFDYQGFSALVRLPAWLKQPAFDGFLVEGTEDFEARFFSAAAPGGRVLDRYQVKTATLSLGEVKGLFAGFKAFDDAHPQTVRSHTLVTPVMVSTLGWLARDPDRVKRSRSFYRPFSTLINAHDAKLHDDFVAEFGKDGAYYAEVVDIETKPVPDRAAAEAAFGAALNTEFPTLDLRASAAGRAFAALLDRVSQRRGELIARTEIESLLAQAGVELPPLPNLPLRMRTADDADDVTVIDIDGAPFSGNDRFPDKKVWQDGLMLPLSRVAAYARDQKISRVGLSGRFRLTTGLCLGWSLRAANGFELDVPTRDGTWRTDAHPETAGTGLPWSVGDLPVLSGGRLAVTVGVLRDPAEAAGATFPDRQFLRVFLNQAITGETDAQESVREIKRAVDSAVRSLRPAAIDLFFVGPVSLAVALGHRWNGLPPTQLYEFMSGSGLYVPTAMIG